MSRYFFAKFTRRWGKNEFRKSVRGFNPNGREDLSSRSFSWTVLNFEELLSISKRITFLIIYSQSQSLRLENSWNLWWIFSKAVFLNKFLQVTMVYGWENDFLPISNLQCLSIVFSLSHFQQNQFFLHSLSKLYKGEFFSGLVTSI